MLVHRAADRACPAGRRATIKWVIINAPWYYLAGSTIESGRCCLDANAGTSGIHIRFACPRGSSGRGRRTHKAFHLLSHAGRFPD
jgi:hypothetical protein